MATTLGIDDDFRVWAEKELQGYAGDTTTPAYRQVTGLVRAFHPTRGWIPVVVPDKDLQKRLESRAAGEPIGELENLYHDPHRGDLLFLGPGLHAEQLPTLMISRPTIKGILDAVRNEVLRWSVALESQGIAGEDRDARR